MKRAIYWWVGHPIADSIIFLAIGGIIFWLVLVGPLAATPFPGAQAAAQVLAAGAVTMIGFTLTVVALIAGALATALGDLDKKWVEGSAVQVKRVVFRPMFWLLLVLILALAVLLVQGTLDRSLAGAIAGASAAAVSSVARNIWIVGRLARA